MPELDLKQVLDVLGRLVDAGIDGAGPLESSYELAAHHRRRRGDPEAAIAALVRAETRKCASVGFLTGLGGFVALPVTVPSAIAGAALIEGRMVGAIAVLRGWSIEDPKVRAFVQACLLGQGTVDALKRAGFTLMTGPGSATSRNALARLATKTISRVPGRAVPLVGGVIGGATDAAVCRSIAAIALRELPAVQPPPDPGNGAAQKLLPAAPRAASSPAE
jgi:hypothetical protein